ncbi:PilW family protein, partial [Acinetobacter indicus]|uniref:PilW family protein n=1 Tax=Acinetobacter indicus TaxID=756892 RepID=UPI0014903F8C
MKRKTASQGYYQAGVSLVELMVGLTIGLIITAGAFAALFSNQKLILEKDKMDRSQENFRFASTTITRLVRQATSFGFPENNNELVVYFDSSQRDCLGEPNHSGVNTFKLNTDNELLCELVLTDGTTQTITLAKNIPGLKFAYGIQNATAYQPYLDESGAINSTVNSVWGTITSVLTQISINDGSAQQPTIDFVATSHLRAMTQLASTGGTSLVNPSIG